MRGTTLHSIYHARLQRMARPVTVKPGGEDLASRPAESVQPLNDTATGYRLFMPGLDNPDGDEAAALWVD